MQTLTLQGGLTENPSVGAYFLFLVQMDIQNSNLPCRASIQCSRMVLFSLVALPEQLI